MVMTATPHTPLWIELCRTPEWQQCLDKIHDTDWMQLTGKEIVRLETSNTKLRFVIPIDRSATGRLPGLMLEVYQQLLDGGASNLVHQYFETGMTSHCHSSKTKMPSQKVRNRCI
jgi:hypothetical protein